MKLKQLFFLSIFFLFVQSEKSQSKQYLNCISDKCQAQLNNIQAANFLKCASSIHQCAIGNFSKNIIQNEIDFEEESYCINECQTRAISQGSQTDFINNLAECSNSCLIDQESESSVFNLTLTILIIVFGIAFIAVLFFVIKACIKKNMVTPQKCEWQIQQELNARIQAEQINQPVQDNLIFPPLTNLPEGDYYKSITNPLQLKPRIIDDDFAKFLYEQTYKKLYGEEIGIQGVLQYGIPLYDFPRQKETKELNIVEAEIYVPQSNPEQAVVDIESLQTNKIQITSQNKQEIQYENPGTYIINIRDIEKAENEKIQVEELICQIVQLQNKYSSKNEQYKQKCIQVRKASANLQRDKKNQIGNQQNLRRLTCI